MECSVIFLRRSVSICAEVAGRNILGVSLIFQGMYANGIGCSSKHVLVCLVATLAPVVERVHLVLVISIPFYLA